jgi:hypothetical protein
MPLTTRRTETAAVERSLLWGEEIPIGKFFERTDVRWCDH